MEQPKVHLIPDEIAFYDEQSDGMLIRRYVTGESDIHGTGVFAVRDMELGEVIGLLHEVVDRYKEYNYTLLGMKINHSNTPNCIILEFNNKRYTSAIRPISKGEELTLDYNIGPDDLEKSPN